MDEVREMARAVTTSLPEHEEHLAIAQNLEAHRRLLYTHPTDMRRFRAALGSVSLIRIISLTPAPPTASIAARLNLSSRWRKRLTWCMDPSAEAAKKSRSVISQTMHDIGWGKWKVVRRDFEAGSHSYDTRSGTADKVKSWESAPLPYGLLKPLRYGMRGTRRRRIQCP